MKKKILKIICAILAVILLFPVPLRLKDGGTVKYQAVLYSVSDVHRLDLDCGDGYRDGWIIEVLGMEIFNNVD